MNLWPKKPCVACGGTLRVSVNCGGDLRVEPCERCDGSGVVWSVERARVTLVRPANDVAEDDVPPGARGPAAATLDSVVPDEARAFVYLGHGPPGPDIFALNLRTGETLYRGATPGGWPRASSWRLCPVDVARLELWRML